MNRRMRRRLEHLSGEEQEECREQIENLDADNKYGDVLSEYDIKQNNIILEVLLTATGIERDERNILDVVEYVKNSKQLFDHLEDFGWYINRIFRKVTGRKNYGFHNQSEIADMDYFFGEIRKSYDGLVASMDFLLNSRMSTIIGSIDNLETKLSDACGSLREQIIGLDAIMEDYVPPADDLNVEELSWRTLKTLGIVDERTIQAVTSEIDEDVIYDVGSSNLVNSLVQPILLLESMKFGIPNDFCKFFVDIMAPSNIKGRYFFAQAIYAQLAQNVGQYPQPIISEDDYVNIGFALTHDPESIVPDSEYMQRMQNVKDLLEKTCSVSHALECIKALGNSGEDYESALKKLLVHGFERETYAKLANILQISEGCELFMLDLLAKNRSAITAYDMLRTAEYDNTTIVSFLRDYSCCKINGGTLSDILIQNRTKPETVKLIVENAFHICCSDFSEEILYLATTLDKGAKGLRYYVAFEKSEEHSKTESVVRYLMNKGASKLHKFYDGLQKYSDSDIHKLAELDDESFFKEVLEGPSGILDLLVTKSVILGSVADSGKNALILEPANLESSAVLSAILPEVIVSEDVVPDLYFFLPNSFQNQFLVEKYCLQSDFRKLGQDAMLKADGVLSAIRDSRYEHALLGQRNLCTTFIKCLAEQPDELVTALRGLPEEGNPYVILSRRLDQMIVSKETEISVKGNGAAQQNLSAHHRYTRIFFVTAGIPSETVTYLESQTNIPVSVVDVDASSSRFQGINEHDLVVYDVTRASHKSYYRAKAQAARHNATFLHANQSNKDVLLKLILSAK